MEKHASIIKTKGNYWIFSQSKTKVGVWIATPPFVKLILDATQKEFVKSLFVALDASQEIVPHPKDLKLFKEDLHKNLEMKSSNKFYSNAKCCEISQIEDVIVLLPTTNVNNKGWFDHLLEFEIKILRSESDEKIFEAIQKTLAKSN